jgi:hypothetical protein
LNKEGKHKSLLNKFYYQYKFYLFQKQLVYPSDIGYAKNI